MTTIMENSNAVPVIIILKYIENILPGGAGSLYYLNQTTIFCLFQRSTDSIQLLREITKISNVIHLVVGKCQEDDRFSLITHDGNLMMKIHII